MQHLDEGTIHAWLDGALPAAEATAAEAHAAACAECARLVAEARGLIARASGILTALDAVPAGVIPGRAAASPEALLKAALAEARAEDAEARARRDVHDLQARRRRRWLAPGGLRAAAAVAFVALGGLAVLRARGTPEQAADVLTAQRVTVASDSVTLRSVAPPTAREERAADAADAAVPAPEPAPARARQAKEAAPSAAGGVAGGASAVAANSAQEAPPRTAPQEQSLAYGDRSRADAPPPAAPVAPVAPAASAAKRAAARDESARSALAERESRVAVEGRITDAASGEPLADAQVVLTGAGKRATTDRDGRFVIADAPPGTHTAEVKRLGYASESQTVRVSADGAAELMVALESAATAPSQQVVTNPSARDLGRTSKTAASAPAAPPSAARAPAPVEASAALTSSARAATDVAAGGAGAAAGELAGCYALTHSPWTPETADARALALPEVISLETAPATTSSDGGAYRMTARALAGAFSSGSWRVVPGRAGAADSLRLHWSAGERTLDARLARDGSSLRGVVRTDAAQRSEVRATRVACPPGRSPR